MNQAKALSQIKGVWGMAFNREGWERCLDRSLDAVFGSFTALVIAAPLMALNLIGLKALLGAEPGAFDDPLLKAPTAFWVGSNLATIFVDWAAGLCAVLAASRFLGASKRAGDAVIGYNWLQPIAYGAQTTAVGAGLLSGSLAIFSTLIFAAAALSIAMYFGVLRRGLGLAPGPAVAVTIASMLLSVIVGALCGQAALVLWGGPQ